MIKLTQAPKSGLHGEIIVPGDKSISHRALMFGAIATGETNIENFLPSDDVMHTMRAFQHLGVSITQNGRQLHVVGRGIKQFKSPKQALDMGNSGTSTRLLMGLLSRQPFDIQLFGDDSLSQRPMKRVATPLLQMSANIALAEDGTLPSTLH